MLNKGLNLVRWQNDPQMSAEQLRRLVDEAVREAREAAATEGYFSARVEASLDEAAEPRMVVLRVEPGSRARVGDVVIRFSGPAAKDEEARELLKRVRDGWNLRRGTPFRQADWDASKRQAARELARWRYAAARIADSRALVDPQTARADLMVELESGPPFRFAGVHVTGTRRYPDDLVEHLNPVRAGDDYDRDKLVVYQRRLLESGYFASVQAEIEAQPQLAGAAPLRVAVIEAPSQHFEAGASYSTDAGPRIEARYSNNDVFDTAWRFKTGLRLDRKIQDFKLEFDTPPRAGGYWNNYFVRQRGSDIQNETTRELSFGVARNFGASLTPSALIVSGHLEEQRVTGDVTDTRHAVYLGHRRIFHKTDDLVSPRSGYYANVELGGAPPGLSTRQFLRGIAAASLFIPLGRDGDLLLRGQGGAVLAHTREGIPTTFLFRTGGDQTVRGYGFESIGVRQGDAVVGGRYLLVGSTEYTRWFGERWGLAAFLDAGDAWDSGVRSRPKVGYGLGGRFRTPIGPVRADLAYGEETHRVRLHFSVGYSF